MLVKLTTCAVIIVSPSGCIKINMADCMKGKYEDISKSGCKSIGSWKNCVHLVLHPLGIAPTYLYRFVFPGGLIFIPIISTKGIYQIKKLKNVIKKLSFMDTKRFNTFFNRWVQFRVGAIPRLPKIWLKTVLLHHSWSIRFSPKSVIISWSNSDNVPWNQTPGRLIQ